MSSIQIRFIVILGALTIIGIFVMQAYYLFKNYNKEESEFHQSVSIALRNTAKIIANYDKGTLPEKGLLIREASNFYKVNVNAHIDQSSLLLTLKNEFAKQELVIPFEYGIYDCGTNELVYNEILKDTTKVKSKSNRKAKSKKTEENSYFIVRFPSKASYMFVEMKSLIISSTLLLLACGIFTMAMFMTLRQKRYSELMRDFVNNMTHEFKTPISSIKISADVLLHHPTVEEDKRLFQYAQIIRDQNQRLNDQVEKVLQIAKMESSSFNIKKEPIDLHEIIRQVSSQYAIRLDDSGGSLTLSLEAKSHNCMADRFHFMNIISNLIDNAIKYSKNDPEIGIFTHNLKDKLILEVRDKGIGIQEEDISKIFEKFFRVSTGDVHNVKGFGIGLYYVKRICDAHGFDVNLQSVYGKGTSIFIQVKTV